MGNLLQLERLWLHENALSGEVPSTLGHLSQLTQLLLNNNALTGPLPRSLMQLENLQVLYFGGNPGLCAPGDAAFQAWLSRIPNTDGPTCAFGFTDHVDDQTFTMGVEIAALVLPEAVGGTPLYTYTLTPALPAGLVFTDSSRTISGTPTVTLNPTPYTYRATDAYASADSLTFSIEVIAPPTGVTRAGLPAAFAVRGSYPNPFREAVRLVLDLPWPARVSVEVTDLLGRRVRTVPPVDLAAGWERGIDLSGAGLSSGVYLYRVQVTSPMGTAVHGGRLVRVR